LSVVPEIGHVSGRASEGCRLDTIPEAFLVLAACLAGLAGYVDGLGFIKLGGFFVSFMSGNSTRLAVGIASNTAAATLAGGLVAAFVLGVILATFVATSARARRKPAVRALISSLLAGAALLDGALLGP